MFPGRGIKFLVKLAVGQLSITFPYMGMALATRAWIGMSSIVLGYQNIIAEHLYRGADNLSGYKSLKDLGCYL